MSQISSNSSKDAEREPVQRRSWRDFLRGWRFGALAGGVVVSIVFLINLTVTIWGSARNRSKGSVLYEGDCDRAKRLNSVLHLIINLLSTVMLGSSNYCMQCLSAPTRKEVDKAHTDGKWLDIGVPSVRNLRQINKFRTILWLFLGLSSLPLHLFFNSAVFSSTNSNSYFAFPVSKAFVDSPECLDCDNIASGTSDYNSLNNFAHFSDEAIKAIRSMHGMGREGKLQRLSNSDCIREYGKMIQPHRRDLLLVVDVNSPPGNLSLDKKHIYEWFEFDAWSVREPEDAMKSYGWICYDRTSKKKCPDLLPRIQRNSESWKLHTRAWLAEQDQIEYNVRFCLSEKMPQHCRVHFLRNILILVTVLNFIKAVLILYVALAMQDEPLMTMGDAVASFLENEDPTTKGMCLASLQDFRNHKNYFLKSQPKQWSAEKNRWKDAVSLLRRWFTLAIYIGVLTLVSGLLWMGIYHLPNEQPRSLTALVSLGFGSVDPRTLINFFDRDQQPNFTEMMILVNTGQVVLSVLYFIYNAIFTSMLLADEWTSYASQRKGLRVSRKPKGSQRSAYFLELPYRFALPLMSLSSLLHWLVSQSIFLAAIDVNIIHEGENAESVMKCGYSPIAIISVLALGIPMVIALVGFGFIPYKCNTVLAGSCSAAISAACHNNRWDDIDGSKVSTEPLMWGVVGVNAEGVGHCSFSTKHVEPPKEGGCYS